MNEQRREFIKTAAAIAASSSIGQAGQAFAESGASIEANDRVFITNEDSNTLVVIDARTNTIESTINLTSFDEDPRPPFRFVTAGVATTHAAMIHKPLYYGCIDAHGAVPSPDGKLLATSGRGSSNIYLIGVVNKRVIGNAPNPAVGPTTNPERLSSGILIGREPHGLWTNPANDLLYVAHEQDELPGTTNAGQTVCGAFDVTDPFNPRFIAQIPLYSLKLPSGELRNKKSINLVYVRPGYRG